MWGSLARDAGDSPRYLTLYMRSILHTLEKLTKEWDDWKNVPEVGI